MPRLPFVCATLFAALSSSYSHSDFSITTERTQYSPGDSITLMVESTNPSDSPIDLSPLQQDFIVLDQRKLMINSYAEGKRNSTVRWEIQLRSRKSGAVEVPALNYNDEQSESISLFVRSQERSRFLPVSDMPIILDAQISLDDNYEQAQFLYVLNVYSDQPLTPGYTVSAPKIERARVELLD
ncbi:MAG: BatD family protein, partial [Pseudomonadales bacterium]